MFPPDPIHTIEHNAVDKLHTAQPKSSRSTRRCYSCRRESTTPVHEEHDCISPTASLLYACPGLVSSASGRACTCIPCVRETPPACTRHTILTPSTGPSTNSARPIHTNIPNPRSASSFLAFTSIAYESTSLPPPYALRQCMQYLPFHRSSTACALLTTGCARKCSAAWVSDSEPPRAIAVCGKY
ncbi:hypothetical protein B0H14DRAFT_352586 [Mycena olivaceomarginata]|nr:hypothetical protein B0H14DRAFT_352586 [Mycena olivaceomarginata]